MLHIFLSWHSGKHFKNVLCKLAGSLVQEGGASIYCVTSVLLLCTNLWFFLVLYNVEHNFSKKISATKVFSTRTNKTDFASFFVVLVFYGSTFVYVCLQFVRVCSLVFSQGSCWKAKHLVRCTHFLFLSYTFPVTVLFYTDIKAKYNLLRFWGGERSKNEKKRLFIDISLLTLFGRSIKMSSAKYWMWKIS